MVRAVFEGQVYLYQPFIFTDNEIPLVAGREIWGFAKKLATMKRSSGGGGAEMFGEQMLFTTERPIGQRIMTMSIACEAIANPSELEDVPVLSTRVIPSSEEGRPAVGGRARAVGRGRVRSTRAPTAPRSCTRAGPSLTMDARSPVDPWHLLAPTRVVQGWYGVFDFDLYHGKVVHDYLADEAIWSSERRGGGGGRGFLARALTTAIRAARGTVLPRPPYGWNAGRRPVNHGVGFWLGASSCSKPGALFGPPCFVGHIAP